MIVRILGEGQYDVTDARTWTTSTTLDSAVEAAVEAGDEAAFAARAHRAAGRRTRRTVRRTTPDSLDESDLILPAGRRHDRRGPGRCSARTA